MSEWEWENTVNTMMLPPGRIVMASDGVDYDRIIISSPEELQALIERLEELAEELGWNNDQK